MINQLYEYIQIASLVVTVASAIAALTPTPTDDKIVAKLYKVIDILAINIGKAKQ